MVHVLNSQGLPDVQAECPDYPINLTRVGVTGVKKLVKVERSGDDRPVVLISNFELFVDLPSDRKGANLSRNTEAIDEVLEEEISLPVYEIEELCGKIAQRLLERHEYASRAEVKMKSEYIVKRQTPATRVNCQEVVDIFAEAIARNGNRGYLRKVVGAEVVGTTACPCAQEITREQVRQDLVEMGMTDSQARDFSGRIPVATHNQRGRGSISIEVRNRRCVSIDRIIRIIEESMSSKVYGLLKRSDEAMVVARAHQNPKFVEDCVRTMAQKVVDSFPDLPDDAQVTLKQINEESIHRHNAFAERTATMGELRSELACTPAEPA
ncbi:MAG: GTP cyclohydrolase MptA [Methanosaeta sp. PtaB.Bin039]|nr:MAG: GTP cyclohydrolase MptA [Methanosaeta sp. PtaB.Bin039]HOT07294.1 GTP cyclohydrolase MptA [Methanotrichaceae archaeon]HQF15819.1 GTP cyclohydrolase MptA [Methanotrichaceae archaeon]HQJ28106.1 GTP cyclohydrolase MptA [Methanotrichaceae archaeon]